MIEFDIASLVPRFILNDRNGRALAKAIEAGLNDFLSVCQTALDTWGNVDEMPEWRLDELAGEYSLVYDYDADVETKRGWIREAIGFYARYGTAARMAEYLSSAFEGVRVEEWFDYGGAPYHFRVRIADTYSDETLAWAQKCISAVKNLRSVLDGVIFEGESAETTEYALAVAAAMEGYAGAVAIGVVPVDETPVEDDDDDVPVMFRD